jgi:hypothetical protein
VKFVVHDLEAVAHEVVQASHAKAQRTPSKNGTDRSDRGTAFGLNEKMLSAESWVPNNL